MRAPIATRLAGSPRAQVFWHVLLIVAVSSAFESLFIHHGIGWLFDEGWPLYAAMQLRAGGELYSDAFFPFPPGHLLPAWIALAVDPPGVVMARWIYAGFDVGLCVALYALGRQFTKPPFALLAALLLAVAAPRSHLTHVLFGYRYFVFSVLALLAFSYRLRTGHRGWMFASGLCTGVALMFRLTPAFAVACGIGVAVPSASRERNVWLRDWGAFALGVAVVVAPGVAWLASGAGFDAVVEQSILRIIPLQSAQSLPVPDAAFPTNFDRRMLSDWFVGVQFWLFPAIYLVYAGALAVVFWQSRRRGQPFGHALLVATVVWGAVYLLRATGRSDEHHLASALPPACLILAHGLSRAFRAPEGSVSQRSPNLQWAACFAALCGWVVLQGSDLYLDRELRGTHRVESLGGRVQVDDPEQAERLDRSVHRIDRLTRPDETILDLTHSPLIYVIANRHGPGFADIVTPGVFADPADERAFVAHLEQAPPALVLWPKQPFDDMPSRGLAAHAPLLAEWVARNYVGIGGPEFREIAMKRRK